MNVFVHGYGTNITSPFQQPLGKEKGLCVVGANTVVAFDWSLPTEFTLSQSLSPTAIASLYQQERKLTRDRRIQNKLSDFLHRQQPSVLLAHSLGCELIVQYATVQTFPTSLRRIVWMQADIDRHACTDLPSQIELINIYCPWDPAMIIGSLYHRSIRAGLLGSACPRARNVLLPATSGPNLHTSCLRDPKIRKYLQQ